SGGEVLEDIIDPLPHADESLSRVRFSTLSLSKSFQSSAWTWAKEAIASYTHSGFTIAMLDCLLPDEGLGNPPNISHMAK
ncbi:hypothetical protein HAX54_023418, partial [Datura stramonium]|nr:hypothetical protein [Datura stramonium]